jgi:hypothetical protein
MDDIEFASQEGAYVYFLVLYSLNRHHGSFSTHLRHCMHCWYPWNGPLRILMLSVRVLVSSLQHSPILKTLTAVYNVLQMRTVTPPWSTQHTLLVWSCSSLVSNSPIVRLPSNVRSLRDCFNCSVTSNVLFREEQGLHRNWTTRV